MKTGLFNTATVSLLAGILILSASCEKNTGATSEVYSSPVLSVATDGTSTIMEARLAEAFVATSELTADELAMLSAMKEEEKLARDVYYALNEKWNAQVFANISNAENNHMTAINNLLKYYDAADTLIAEPGVFTDPAVLTLYNDLVAKGSVSLEEAYVTGATIEDMDINDLQEDALLTTNENILMVFENLERGSRNHLRAFTRLLSSFNLTYTPVYITAEEYSQIISTPNETGKAYQLNSGCGMKKNKHGRGRGQGRPW